MEFVKGEKKAKITDTLDAIVMGESIYMLQLSAAVGFGFVFIAEFGII